MDTKSPQETMTTREVAEHLGISIKSVGNTMARRGIHPLYRTPGMGGQSVYDAELVRRGAPVLAVVDGPTDADDLAFVPVVGRCRRVVTVDVVEVVKGAPNMLWSRGQFSPTRIAATFTSDNGEPWSESVTVYGFRVRADGSGGADDAFAHIEINSAPAWLVQWIADRTPAADQR